MQRFFEAQCKKALIEEYVDGKHIDVICDGVAYEITLHFDNMIENIEKNISAGMPENVVIVDKGHFDKAEKLLKEHPELDAKVEKINKYFHKKGGE